VWILIIRSFVLKIRARRFYERVLPPLAKFMEERTPLLERHYANARVSVGSTGRTGS